MNNKAATEPPAAKASKKPADRIAVSPVGIGVALAGAAAMVIAVFLPYIENEAYAENSLIQSSNGGQFIIFAVAIAGAAYRAYRVGVKTVAVIVLGGLATAMAIYLGLDSETLTLYPLDANGGVVAGSEGTEYAPGPGIYLAGVGGLLAMAGGFQMRGGKPDSQMKTCPDCAEQILADAKVCKHCGLRFSQEAPIRTLRLPRHTSAWHCDLCDEDLDNYAAALLHADEQHPDTPIVEARAALREVQPTEAGV